MIRAVVIFVVLFLLGAFRGGFLFGWASGLFIGTCFGLSGLMLWDSFASKIRFDFLRQAVAISCFAFLLLFILVPTWMFQSANYSIDRTAIERKMRSELNEVFLDDSRFSSLRTEFTRLKGTHVSLTGNLPDSSAFDDARAAIGNSCPTVCEMAHVSWDIRLTDSHEHLKKNDGKMGQYRTGGH